MTLYRNTFNNRTRESDVVLGYPWVADVLTAEYEPGERTAEAILADVGDDPELARAALEQEQQREKPRKVLSANLQRIIDRST